MVEVAPPGDAVTVYAVTGSPWSTSVGFHATYPVPFAANAVVCVGASGTARPKFSPRMCRYCGSRPAAATIEAGAFATLEITWLPETTVLFDDESPSPCHQ